MKVAAVVLAAGRGSRMKDMTKDRPKCLVELCGKPLLHWQLDALKLAGIKQICVVRGYLPECLNGDFDTVENPNWEYTNMLSSLRCSDRYVQECFSKGSDRILISYSDIVYHPAHVASLKQSKQDITITYDTLWEDLWSLRFGDPLCDAETFRQENGLLQEIGGKPKSMNDIHGQYMGLLLFTKEGWSILKRVCQELGVKCASTDMTAFLRILLTRGISIGTIGVAGKWCEIDSESDKQKYEEKLSEGCWSHDWRY